MINAVFNNTKVTLVVLDNSTTAMTGFQPHPGSADTGEKRIKQEDIARACGMKFVEVVDPLDFKKAVDTVERAMQFDGPSFIVFRHPCAIQEAREKRQRGEKVIPYRVDQEKCTKCKLCVNSLGCPALLLIDDVVTIDSTQCTGCGLCAQICPTKAIIQDKG
jgi:indolepyruvate ferredoxin oxidoreductase alpha subunit